jgi:hypothetical protein
LVEGIYDATAWGMARNPKGVSYMAMQDLCGYYGLAEPQGIMTMNTLKYRHKKCAATTEREPGVYQAHPDLPFTRRLVAPEVPSDGTEQWFLHKWSKLLPPDQEKFRSYMSGLLKLTDPLDFCVDVDEREGVTMVVIFYINSVLTRLAEHYFRTAAPLQQALDILHRPDGEYMAFRSDALDHHQEYFQDGSGAGREDLSRMRACLEVL